MRLSEFECLVIDHWLTRASRSMHRAVASANVEAETRTMLLEYAGEIDVSRSAVLTTLRGMEFSDPDVTFTQVSDLLRQAAKDLDAHATAGRSEKARQIGAATSVLTLTLSLPTRVGDAQVLDPLVIALKSVTSTAVRGCGVADLLLPSMPIAPWNPGSKAKAAQPTRTQDAPRTVGGKKIGGKKPASKKATGRTKSAAKKTAKKSAPRTTTTKKTAKKNSRKKKAAI